MLEAVFLMLPALTAVIYQELHCILVFLGSAVFCLGSRCSAAGKKTGKYNDIFCRRLCERCTLLGGS